jgi:polysaccharide deacetylase family protein (PEP-CTERM system associated)
MLNALTVDVEEYFHPTEVQASIDGSQWALLPSRVGDELTRILDLLATNHSKATFFILGWVAQRHPATVRAIVSAGHEIGCHSHLHRLVYSLSPGEFRRDTRQAVAAIEDACGITPRVYRAPSYSITKESLWALEILAEEGFVQDSSIFPIAHDRYGIPGSNRHAYMIETRSGPIQEIPAATVKLSNGTVAPIGGGGYLRLLPYRYTAAGIRRVNREEGEPVCIYFHPWEIDPDQPRLASGLIARVRTYFGVRGMLGKLERLMRDFSFSSIGEVYALPGGDSIQPRDPLSAAGPAV